MVLPQTVHYSQRKGDIAQMSESLWLKSKGLFSKLLQVILIYKAQ